MKMQTGDIIDRLSILILKVVHEPNVLAHIREELNDLFFDFDSRSVPQIYALFDLLGINSQIWNLESDIRAGKEGKLGLEEVGERALTIRDLNKRRVMIKNGMSKYKEIKISHASE